MKRFLRITQENVFNQYQTTSPVQFYPRLSSSGAFTTMENPEFWGIQDGTGLNVPALSGTVTMGLQGTLITEVGPTLAQKLFDWAGTRINDDQDSPWTTNELPRDLASCTCDFAWSNFNVVTLNRRRYLGVKVASLSASCSKSQPKLMANMQLIGSTPQGNHYDSSSDPDATAFPEPALTVYPDDCYLFQNLSGNVSILGDARTNFDSWTMNLQNQLVPYFDESHFANAIRLGGRSFSVQLRLRLKSTPDDWARYKQGTTGSATYTFDNGSNTLKVDQRGKVYIKPLQQEQPIDQEHYYTMTLVSQLDTSTGDDFQFTYT